MDNYKILPDDVYIESTNYCNLLCKMCPHGYGLVKNKGFMDYAFYKSIIDQIVGIKGFSPRIGLHMNGEPLLHKNFPEMVRYASDRGFYTFIHTNGMLLNEKVSHELISAGISEISFSFEGEEPERYEKTRVNSSHEKVKKNIQYFLEQKKDTKVIIEVLKFRGQDDLKISRDFKKDFPGVKFTSFFASDWSGTLNDPLLKEDKIYSKEPSPCRAIQSVIAIAWNGQVLSCCIDYDFTQVIGDLKKDSLLKIWHGEKRKSILKKMLQKNFDEMPLCRHCGAPYTVKTKERKVEK